MLLLRASVLPSFCLKFSLQISVWLLSSCGPSHESKATFHYLSLSVSLAFTLLSQNYTIYYIFQMSLLHQTEVPKNQDGEGSLWIVAKGAQPSECGIINMNFLMHACLYFSLQSGMHINGIGVCIFVCACNPVQFCDECGSQRSNVLKKKSATQGPKNLLQQMLSTLLSPSTRRLKVAEKDGRGQAGIKTMHNKEMETQSSRMSSNFQQDLEPFTSQGLCQSCVLDLIQMSIRIQAIVLTTVLLKCTNNISSFIGTNRALCQVTLKYEGYCLFVLFLSKGMLVSQSCSGNLGQTINKYANLNQIWDSETKENQLQWHTQPYHSMTCRAEAEG